MKLKIILSFTITFGIFINGYSQTFNPKPNEATKELNDKIAGKSDPLSGPVLFGSSNSKEVELRIYGGLNDNGVITGLITLKNSTEKQNYKIVANCYEKQLNIKTELYICIYLDDAKRGYPMLAKYKITNTSNYRHENILHFSPSSIHQDLNEFRNIELSNEKRYRFIR